MEIPLKQAPDRLFDQQKWSEFISHFDTREIALGRLSVHPSDPGGFYREGDAKLVKSGEGRWKQIDELYELGIALVGDFKTADQGTSIVKRHILRVRPKCRTRTDPPRISKSSISKGMSHELGQPKRREFCSNLGESRRIVPEWTSIRTLGHRRGSRGAMRLLPRDRGGRAGVPQGGPADCGRVPRISRRQVAADPVRTCREGGSVPPSKGGTPLYPPSLVTRKATPPGDP